MQTYKLLAHIGVIEKRDAAKSGRGRLNRPDLGLLKMVSKPMNATTANGKEGAESSGKHYFAVKSEVQG